MRVTINHSPFAGAAAARALEVLSSSAASCPDLSNTDQWTVPRPLLPLLPPCFDGRYRHQISAGIIIT